MSGSTMSRILERCSWTTDLYIGANWDPSLRKNDGINLENNREIFKASDSASVAIDWLDLPDDVVKKYQGLLIIFAHGLTGHIAPKLIESAHAVAFSHKLGVCVVTVQGAIGFSNLNELKAVTDRIALHVGPSLPKIGVGFSIGGIPALEFFAQDKGFLTGMILISCPLNLSKFLSQEECTVTNAMLVSGKRLLVEHAESNSLSEFLAAVKVDSAASDAYSSLESVKRPTLLIYALDDASINFSHNLDLVRVCRNPHIAVAVLESGGHCEFFSATRSDWLMHAVSEFGLNCTR